MSGFAGAVAGACVGCGLVLILTAVRRPGLTGRIAPYIDASGCGPGPGQRAVATVLARFERLVGAVSVSPAQLRRRLQIAGGRMNVRRYRLDQIIWGCAGLVLGSIVAVPGALTGRLTGPAGAGALVLLAGAAGVAARDLRLGIQIRHRKARITTEFPAAVDLVALAVTAGMTPLAALDSVRRAGSGPLGEEFARIGADIRGGDQLATALERFAERTDLAATRRFVDATVLAIERGSPLAEVLRTQAADAREQRRRDLIEIAGRKEISMMVPVVFLILPVTVVFALFPGLAVLDLTA